MRHHEAGAPRLGGLPSGSVGRNNIEQGQRRQEQPVLMVFLTFKSRSA